MPLLFSPSWRLPLLLVVVSLLMGTAVACGDDDGGDGGVAGTTAPASASSQSAAPGGFDTRSAPVVRAPASLYSILLEDVGFGNYITDIRGTYELVVENYSETAVFRNPADGAGLLRKWGYINGYETAMTPEGGEAAILNGGFVVIVETHVFKTTEGATEAYDFFLDVVKKNGVSQPVTAQPVGNSSYYARTVQGTIRGTTIGQAIHQVVFRRGNLVAIVRTIGSEPLMRVTSVRDMAMIVDSKALGTTRTIEPTPTSNFTPPPGSVRTTPAAAAPTPTPKK